MGFSSIVSGFRVGTLALGLAVLAGGAMSLPVVAAPEPEVVPTRWELKAKFSPLRVLTVDTPEGPRAFVYMTYEVTNTTGQDVLFAPTFDLVTADGTVERSGKGVSAEATKKVIAYVNDPEVKDQIAVIGSLLQGEENARVGIVIWSGEQLRPGELTVYAAGFSGESTTVTPPKTAGGKAAAEGVVLRKTKSLTYRTPGEISQIKDTPMNPVETGWVMR